MPLNSDVDGMPAISHDVSALGSVRADPMLHGGRLLLCGYSGTGLYEIDYDPGPATGFLVPRWEVREYLSLSCRYASPVKVGDYVYGMRPNLEWNGERWCGNSRSRVCPPNRSGAVHAVGSRIHRRVARDHRTTWIGRICR